MAFIAEWDGFPNAYHMISQVIYNHTEKIIFARFNIYRSESARINNYYGPTLRQFDVYFLDRSVTGDTPETAVETPLFTQFLTSEGVGGGVISNLSEAGNNVEKAVYEIIKTQNFAYSTGTSDEVMQYVYYLGQNGIDA